jgi:hypothetical protein
MRVSCYFGCFACVALHFFLKKKEEKKYKKKATPSTRSAHDLFSMQHADTPSCWHAGMQTSSTDIPA